MCGYDLEDIFLKTNVPIKGNDLRTSDERTDRSLGQQGEKQVCAIQPLASEKFSSNKLVRIIFYLLNPSAKVVKSIGMNVTAGQDGQEVLLWQGQLVPLDEVDALVLERGRPVGVADQVSGEVLADHQLLLGENKVRIAI